MIVEFSGTPKSGKDSIIETLYKGSTQGEVEIIEEIVRRSPFSNDDFELRLIWTVLTTYAEAKRVEGIQNPALVVFNRGLFDAIAFLRLLHLENRAYAHAADHIENSIRESGLLSQIHTVFLVLTSYEKAVMRKDRFKGHANSSPRRIVNPRIIRRLNRIYLTLLGELRDRIPIVLINDVRDQLSLEQKISIVQAQMTKLG